MGRALDALLASSDFATWLSAEPTASWTNINVFLTNGQGQGITPTGPAWEIDVIRETNVPRSWAISFVDAYSGKVVSRSYCNVPGQK